MPLVVVVMGSNIAAEHHLPQAMRGLKETVGRPLRVSRVYETPPVGAPGTPWFLNAAVLLETGRSLSAVRMALRRLESRLGRVRTQDPNAPRTIDLDPVLWRDAVDAPVRVLVMRDLLQYAHTAIPVAEVVPDWPFQGRPLRDWARRFQTQARGFRLRPEVHALLLRWVEGAARDASGTV